MDGIPFVRHRPRQGPSRKTVYDAELAQAQAHRAEEDARYFGNKLPAREHWRLYGQGSFTSLVEGESLTRQRLCEELAHYDLLVTFNGTSFDLPVLLASIQGLPLDQPHVDLCFLGRQLGYRGGLKAIEHQLGIPRRADLWGMSGADAGQLWNRWRRSRDEKARERLLACNEADCVNLQPLADLFYCRMVQQRRGEGAALE